MKTRTTELDVDYIGSEVPLTKAEESALSNYFEMRRAAAKQATPAKLNRAAKRKTSVK